MLDQNSPLWLHGVQNVAVIALSILFLPLDATLLLWSYTISFIRSHGNPLSNTKPADNAPSPPTVLVTGLSMTKALSIARSLAAHPSKPRIIGADFTPLASGLYSRAISKRFTLTPPSPHAGPDAYVLDLHSIIVSEKVDLWVSCSGVASAVEDGVAMEAITRTTNCRCVQFDVPATECLHEKAAFIEYTQSLGLPVPQTHRVTSRDAAEKILARYAGSDEKFIMKPVGMDDSFRADMTLLPFADPRRTSDHLARLPISDLNPWILQQFIKGKEYCTHSLVVNGEVKAFVACPSAELLMHYVALTPASPLSKAMLEFTRSFAARSEEKFGQRGATNGRSSDGLKPSSGFTGHLSFDFLVQTADLDQRNPDEIRLYPIECNPRAHTAIALFNSTPELADAYMSILSSAEASRQAPIGSTSPIVPIAPPKIHWVPHDFIACLISPLYRFAKKPSFANFWNVLGNQLKFEEMALYWKDGTYSLYDPLPYFVLYHIYWPYRCLQMLWQQRKWSRMNVSTGKMFEC